MRRLMMIAAFVALAAPVSAQNVANNNGIWWGGPAGGPAPFTLLNPLTTVYGRIGITHAWQSSGPYAYDYFPGVPPSVDMPNRFGFVAGFGARLMPAVRYELQFGGTFTGDALQRSPMSFNTTRSRYSSFQVMNNFYLDGAPFLGFGAFNPYVMGGVGVSFNRAGDFTTAIGFAFPGTGKMVLNLAWNIGAGIQYQVLNNLIVDIGYRYIDLGRFRSNQVEAVNTGGHSGNVTAHQVMLSLVVPLDGLARGY